MAGAATLRDNGDAANILNHLLNNDDILRIRWRHIACSVTLSSFRAPRVMPRRNFHINGVNVTRALQHGMARAQRRNELDVTLFLMAARRAGARVCRAANKMLHKGAYQPCLFLAHAAVRMRHAWPFHLGDHMRSNA